VFETDIGAGALQIIRKADHLHLLFTDINLADAVNGWDVAEAGRVSYSDLAVIYASGGPKEHARLVPGSIFLSKPVSQDDIMLACSRLRLMAVAR
jgi:CheY-like chemotaxis protein